MNINDFKVERFKWGLSQEERKSLYEKNTQKGAEFFSAFSLPTLLYAIGFTLCFYDAHRGITIPVLMMLTCCYIYFIIKKFEKKPSTFSYLCMGIAFLIGFSIFLTDNGSVIFIDYLVIYLLFMTVLMDTFFNINKWTLGLSLKNIFKASIYSFSFIDRPINDIKCAGKVKRDVENKIGDKVKYALIGMAVSVPFFIILGVILSSADEYFRDFIGHFFEELFKTADIFFIPLMIIIAYAVAYVIIRYLCSGEISDEEKEKTKYNEIIGIAFLASILLLYLSFCLIQIRYLFFNDGSLPSGVTYSTYAQNGFYQLLFVSVLNLIMVLVMKQLFNNSKVLNFLLVACCCMTYIIIASAAFRMKMYIDVYYLTFDRVLVLLTLLILSIILAGIIMFILNDNFPIYKYCVLTMSICIMIFSFAKVDAIIAKYDIEKWSDSSESTKHKSNGFDYEYLAELSLDAAPYVIDYIQDEIDFDAKAKMEIKEQLKMKDNQYREGFLDDSDSVKAKTHAGRTFRGFIRNTNYKHLRDTNLRNFNISVHKANNLINDLADELN